MILNMILGHGAKYVSQDSLGIKNNLGAIQLKNNEIAKPD